MSVIFFLIGIGIVVAGGFLFAFIWAVKSGQYDDDYTPSVRILFDDYKPGNEPGNNNDSKIKASDDSKKMKKSNNKKS
jgi:cbb3-type cytochrome oxidase maturation protein